MPSVSFRGRRTAIACAVLGLAVAAAAAGVFREKLSVPWYLWKLESRDEAERSRAADRLGELRSAWAVPRLVEILRTQESEAPRSRDSQPNVYEDALVRIGAPAVPALLGNISETGVSWG